MMEESRGGGGGIPGNSSSIPIRLPSPLFSLAAFQCGVKVMSVPWRAFKYHDLQTLVNLNIIEYSTKIFYIQPDECIVLFINILYAHSKFEKINWDRCMFTIVFHHLFF